MQVGTIDARIEIDLKETIWLTSNAACSLMLQKKDHYLTVQ